MSTLEGFDWFQPEDLPVLFKALRQVNPPAILVGGQSLTFWVDFFELPIPQTSTPFLTQDADILGSKLDAQVIAKHLKNGKAKTPQTDDHTPSTGMITYDANGRKLLIDVMGTLCGLENDEIKETAITLNIAQYGDVSILHPRLVLISRISNLKVLQSKRDKNGITQAKLAIEMYKSFMIWFSTQLSSNSEYQAFLLSKAEELKHISLSDASVYVYQNYGINILDSFPIGLVENQKFLEIQWPNINKWFLEKAKPCRVRDL